MVQNPSHHPFWAIGSLKAYFKTDHADFIIRGTATLISQKYLLTVAHNIYNHDHQAEAV